MAYKLIGQNFTPYDVEAKVTGRAKYAEDFRAEGMVFAKTLTSPIPHGKINSIDTSAAEKMPGVVGILTNADCPQFPPPNDSVLAQDYVRYVGEPILVVAAETELQAANAIAAINIDFTPLPHVIDPLESLFPGGPDARADGNVAGSRIDIQYVKWDAAEFAKAGDSKLPEGKPAEEWTYGDVEAGLAAAKLVLDESWVTGGLAHHCMEPRTSFAYWQGGKCFLHASMQSNTAAIPNTARFIGIKPDDLVFIAEYCGGGFGSKIAGYPTVGIAALMSKKINRPVMHRITRLEEYAMVGAARPTHIGRIKLGFREDGRLIAADYYVVQENGPNRGAGDFRAAGNAMSLVYQPESMRWRALPVLTNTPPPGAQRGPGENQLAAALEPLMDKAARQLGIDRLEIRKINAPDSNSKMGADQGPITCSFIKEALDKGAEMFGWDEMKKLSGQKNGNKVTGVGIGQAYHSAGSNGYDGLLRITADGVLHIHTGVGNLGTHSHAATARVAAEFLNYNWDNTVEERGDTRLGLPWNSNQAGSLTASTESRTMYAAAMEMKTLLTEIAAKTLGGQPSDYDLGDEKVVSKADPSKSITYAQAAQKAMELGGKYVGDLSTVGEEETKKLNDITKSAVAIIQGTGLIAVAKDEIPRVGTIPGLVVSFAQIELDTETGKFEIKKMLSVADCGTVLHPMGLANTMKGGGVQGIGMAAYEHRIYDHKLGIPAAMLIWQSKPPTYLDVPAEYATAAVELPDPQNPVGAKGTGEPSLGAPASAITSALADAVGYTFNRTPVTLDMILNYLNGRPQAHKPLQINTV